MFSSRWPTNHIPNWFSKFSGHIEWKRGLVRIQDKVVDFIHHVFHVSQLKPFTPNYTPVFAEVARIPDLSAQEVIPEAFDRQLVKKGIQAIPQVLIKWKGIPATSSIWEGLGGGGW
jgi:hypothetical protein